MRPSANPEALDSGTSKKETPPFQIQGQDSAYCVPERFFQDRYLALLVFTAAGLYLQFFKSYTTLHSDEGIVLEGAERILRGQVLYRDFFSFFTPGSYYWTAFLMRVFGNSILAPRTALMIYGGLFSMLGYLLARRVSSRPASLLAVGMGMVVSLPYSFYVQHSWDSSLLALLSIYCAVRMLESSGSGWTFGTASFTALTVLFEHSRGGGLVLGLAIGFGFLMLRKTWKVSLKQLLALTVGFVWPFVLTCAYFGSKHALGAMADDWIWPLQHYSAVNRVSYGYLHLSSAQWNALHAGSWLWRVFAFFVISPVVMIALLPFLTFGILAWQALRFHQGEQRPRSAYYVLMGAGLLGLWLPVAILRADLAHLVYLMPLFAIAGAWILDGRDIPLKALRISRPVLVWYLVGSFAAFGLALFLNAAGAKNVLSTRRGLLKSADTDSAIPYIQAHVPPGQNLFVYPYQPLYYYLTATSNPTGFDFLQPGLHTAEQFHQMLTELEKQQTNVVIFTPSFRDFIAVSWPDTPLSVIAAKDPVAEYLLQHYRVCQVMNSGPAIYWFMLRMNQPCPEGAQFAR
jgi:hypothetical protein